MSEFSARSQRNLYILAGLTAAAVLTALLTVFSSDEAVQTDFVPVLMFPELADQVNSVTRIDIETPSDTFDIRFDPDAGWTLPSKRNFPADEGAIRQLILALADLRLIEPKTARAELHRQIGLGDPGAGGSGVKVSAFDKRGAEFASVVVGDRHRGSSTAGVSVIYVRKPDEDQTWLARGRLTVERDSSSWIKTDLFDIARKDVYAVRVTSRDEKSYVLTRNSEGSDAFSLDAVPEGRRSKPPYSINSVAYALPTLSIADVVSDEAFSFEPETTTTYTLYNGTQVTLSLGTKDEKYYASFAAQEGEPILPPQEETGSEEEVTEEQAGSEEDAPAEEAGSEEETLSEEEAGSEQEVPSQDAEGEAALDENAEGENIAAVDPQAGPKTDDEAETVDTASGSSSETIENVTSEDSVVEEESESSGNIIENLLGAEETEEVQLTSKDQANDLNERLAGWVFEVPEFKYQQLSRPLEDLLEPLDEEEEGASE